MAKTLEPQMNAAKSLSTWRLSTLPKADVCARRPRRELDFHLRTSAFICGFLFFLATCLSPPSLAQTARELPEPAGQTVERKVAFSSRDMVSAAHPLATQAGVEMLAKGGSAIDAAVAVQMVLNLVEPQSSGIGGGSFMLHYDAKRNSTIAYDGREIAPQAATPTMFLGEDGKPIRVADAVRSGRSFGVPGTLRSLEAAHAAHGKLPWASLFQPVIRLAENGYALSARTVQQAGNSTILRDTPETRVIFFNADGSPKAVGTLVKNPALAATMKRIASDGADAFYAGEIARDIVAAVRSHTRPGVVSEADFAAYRVRISDALCGGYRGNRVCSMPMPSSGGVAILQILGMLERFDFPQMKPDSVTAAHLFAEAGRLAFADREKFAADDRFAEVPVADMISPAYLRERSALIRADRSLGRATAGNPAAQKRSLAGDATLSVTGTSHFSIVDANGNAVSMTSSVDASFGSQIFVRGFFLNNQMTDFSLTPTDVAGVPVANNIAPGKRPRSSMAPVMIFDDKGKLKMVIGSALGATIVNSVTKAIIGVLDWQLDIQAAIALPNGGSRNGPTDIERGANAEALANALRAIGHEVRIGDIPSGLHGVLRVPNGWQGGVDPRREGVAGGR
jgi:gamma-glutamyltranspeptidase / glutathione hydrolase